MKIYNRLQLVRTERGISRQVLAKKVDVNFQTIGFIERGDYSPSLELALKIANALEADISEVFASEPFPSLFNKKGSK